MNKGSRLALVVMILGAIIMVYPYAFMLGSSFKTRKEFAEDRQSLIPPRFQPSEVIASWRGEKSAREWPGADWPLHLTSIDLIGEPNASTALVPTLVELVKLQQRRNVVHLHASVRKLPWRRIHVRVPIRDAARVLVVHCLLPGKLTNSLCRLADLCE